MRVNERENEWEFHPYALFFQKKNKHTFPHTYLKAPHSFKIKENILFKCHHQPKIFALNIYDIPFGKNVRKYNINDFPLIQYNAILFYGSIDFWPNDYCSL